MQLRTLEGGMTGFVCYPLGNFVFSQNDPLTDITVVLELELTRDNTTSVTQVIGYTYASMLLLHRSRGTANHFVLMDTS